MKKIEDVARHIILYSKNHYHRSGDTVADLQQIVGKLISMDPEYVSYDDILYWLNDAMAEVYSPEQILAEWREGFIKRQISPFNGELDLLGLKVVLANEKRVGRSEIIRIIAKHNVETLTSFYLSFLRRLVIKDESGAVLYDLGEPDQKLLLLAADK